MPSKLDSYKAKRDRRKTPEPAGDGKPKRRSRKTKQPRFTIQEHHARRLHWDLRLEHDGVLLSWAIPKGIPESPGDNRLAVRTEDHPLEYLDFEGDIPKGQYGAGTMRIWDTGTYDAEKLEDRKVQAIFHGERMKGRYALFATKGDNWMIHRMDPPADPGRDPFPQGLQPMLAKVGQLPRNADAFAYELKWDGIRALYYWRPGDPRIESRNLADITARYPELRGLGNDLGSREAVLDGEIVAFDAEGKPSFERLQQRMNLASDSAVRRRMKDVPVTYVIFDLVYLDGRDLCALTYEERRQILDGLELTGPSWQAPGAHRGDGKALLAATAEQGLEGVVAKRLDSRYEPGRRSGAWVKVKNRRSTEVVIGGWLPGEGRRKSFGALLVGRYDVDGNLRYGGRVGTGFTEKRIADLLERLKPLTRKTSPFGPGSKPPRGANYVKPELVCQVEYAEWTNEGLLRAPAFKGLCDLDPGEVVMDAPVGEAPEDADADLRPALSLGEARKLPKGALEVDVEGRPVRISNFDKVLYPKAGFTKGQLIDYFVRISPVLLPHLRDRPLTLKRYPEGVEGQYFYEKQCPSHRPDWVQTAAVSTGRKTIDFCLANDLPTLVWAGNLADIELHTSLSHADPIERPTMMVFDLDPGPRMDIVDCCQVGLWIRELFDQLSLESFAKTSGSKGLQLYVPLNTDATYDDTKPFAKAVAELLEKQHPKAVVSRQSKELRAGKVLVDWSQNDEHKTTVCVYSPRAKERPTVSTPVSWDEVQRCHRKGDASLLVFDTEQVLARVDDHGDLFAPVLSMRQDLPDFS